MSRSPPGKRPGDHDDTGTSVGLLLALLLGAASADAQTFRWVDDEGNPHYVGSLDQVPEQYRYSFERPC